ncbi:conserved hypothetical protein [Ricinus communis]|uniref:Uncharacterized protein n=1 Tax=Ricinus communis TaxID=3988 RepID=B9TDI8_RICCO|nr:conserved hypothetical protein [Ricinus communis]
MASVNARRAERSRDTRAFSTFITSLASGIAIASGIASHSAQAVIATRISPPSAT